MSKRKRKPQIFNINESFGLEYIRHSIIMNIRRMRDSRIRSVLVLKDSNTKNFGGEHMRIKFIKHETIKTKPNAAGKSYPMIRVVGEALEGSMIGQEWSTKFFPSMKDMASVVKTLSAGDVIDITMKQNGNFLNPTRIDIVADAGETGGLPDALTMGKPQFDNKVSDRRINMSTAVAIMGPKKVKDDPIQYIMDASGVADLIDDYAKQKGAFQFDPDTAKNGIPEMEDDDKPMEEEEEIVEAKV